MPTLHWLTREQDLKATANAEYRLLEKNKGATDYTDFHGLVSCDTIISVNLCNLWLNKNHRKNT
jgi:hypothetical protein